MPLEDEEPDVGANEDTHDEEPIVVYRHAVFPSQPCQRSNVFDSLPSRLSLTASTYTPSPPAS